MKRPASQWYWADWLRAPEVRASSLAARGLWMDMMALMHEGAPYGHLTVGGEAVTPAQLARMVGESPGKVRKLLEELERNAVFSTTDGGTIYSRRMVRDEHIRNVRSAAGKLGGNPTLTGNHPDNPELADLVEGLVKQTDKQKPTPSSSTSASASSPEETTNYNIARGVLLSKLPEGYRGDLEAFLRGLGSITRQFAWIRNLDAKLTGMHPPVATPESVGAALRQLAANGEQPNWKRFEGYLRRMAEPPERAVRGAAPRAGRTLAATQLIAAIRNRRNPMFPQSLNADWQEGLSVLDVATAKAFGVTRILNDTNEGTLVSQLAKALEEAENNQPEESAA